MPKQSSTQNGLDLISESNDPLLELFFKAGSPTFKYQVGLICCFSAGIFLTIGHSLDKQSRSINSAWSYSGTQLTSLIFKLCLSAALFIALLDNKSSAMKYGESSGELASQFFWIGLFSLTGKAALSISYGGGYYQNDVINISTRATWSTSSVGSHNPHHCKIMCLIGLAYCTFVDCKVFTYVFEPIQIALIVAITVMTLIMLAIHAKMYDEMTEKKRRSIKKASKQRISAAALRTKRESSSLIIYFPEDD